MFKNKKIISKLSMFISVLTLLLPNNFAGAAKCKKLSSNNFTYKRRRLLFKKIGVNGKKNKNLPIKIMKQKNDTYKLQNQSSNRRKLAKTSKKFLDNREMLTDNFLKKQSQDSDSKKATRNSKEFANEHKTLTDTSLETQNRGFNFEKAIQVTKKFVGEHKVLTGTMGTTTGLFAANRIYNLKKYHKKLPLATAQICNSSPFQMHFLNVGEGDCILIRYNDGNQFHNWLVDVGYNLGFGLTDVTQYLKKLDVKNLDGIILTHPHPDHYWNLKYVLNNNVKNFYHSYMSDPVKLIDKINSFRYEERVTKPVNSFKGEKINVATHISQSHKPYPIYEHNNFSIKALGPLKKHKDVNDNSIVLLITYGEKKILLMGDAGIDAEKELMDKYGEMIKDVDMVKIGHHGNNSSSSKEFVKHVNPKIAVCSTGGQFVTAGLLNVHEQPWVMNRWKACHDGKCEILTTEEQNNIVLYCENSNDSIKSAHLGRNAEDLV